MTSQIPGYQVIKKIGDGGMSSVYLAIQFSIGREVALKVLSPELRDDPNFAERFYREANIVGTLSHPNVISIYDIGKHQQNFYMAMDYLPGAACSDLIKAGLVTPAKALKIVKDIAAALVYVHKQGYLHCDVKPDNILFRSDGSAVLTDFGITREIHGITNSTTISGTPHYMSPEQAQGKKLELSSDIYSLGVLLYELLTGKPPYTGADAIAVAIKHVSAPVPTLPSEFKDFQPLINRMMHKRPSARFSNTQALIEAIDYIGAELLEHEVIDLSWKLKRTLFIDKLKSKAESLSGINKHLQFSLKHGLLYKVADEDIELPDVELIEQALKNNTTMGMPKTSDTTNTSTLKNDVIALAIEAQQAKVVIPAWQLYLLISIIIGATLFSLGSDIFLDTLGQLTGPKVIYVD